MQKVCTASLSFALFTLILWNPHPTFSQVIITPTPEYAAMCQPDVGVPHPPPPALPSSANPYVPPNAYLYPRIPYQVSRGNPELCEMYYPYVAVAPNYLTAVPNNPGAPIVPAPIVQSPNTPTAVVPNPNVVPSNAPRGPAYVYPYPYTLGNIQTPGLPSGLQAIP